MERRLKKLKDDSYAVRREEGRPKHGQTSFAILGIGSVSWFIFALAVVLPKWRTNYMGMLGYPHTRSWGLFAIVGMESTSYHDYMGNTCRYYTQMAPAGVCITPICLWYRTKCMVSFQMLAACYATGFFFLIVLILHSLCLVWTMRMTPRLIRWAGTWWVAEAILHIAILAFYTFMTSECFQSLDNESLYPEPNFDVCFYMECVVIIMVGANAVLGMTLMKMWPESSSSSGSDETSSVDSDGNPIVDQGYPGGPPPGYPGGPPPGYPGGPPPGYPGDSPLGYPAGPPGAPPQGFDPNVGYDPNLGGYDPNMGYGGPPPGQGPPPGYGGPPPGYGSPGGQWQG